MALDCITVRNVADRICTENQNTHFMFNNFFPENRNVYEIMWENICRAGEATGGNMTHAYCVLENECYRHTC